MPDKPVRAVIFDLDGTLLNTLPDIAYSINSRLEANGYATHPADAFKRMVGSGIVTAVRRALAAGNGDAPPGVAEQIAREVNETYARNPAGHTVFYDGMRELLDRLQRHSVPMAVLSNKPHELVVLIADELLGDWEFVGIHGQREGVPKKPDPTVALTLARQMHASPGEVLFLGDSDIDMQTAANAGMVAAGAAWGFRGAEELAMAGASVVVNEPLEVAGLIELGTGKRGTEE
jgi:phosphoglycolate phosphatase